MVRAVSVGKLDAVIAATDIDTLRERDTIEVALEERDTAGERLGDNVPLELTVDVMVLSGALIDARDDALALTVSASVDNGVTVVEKESIGLPGAHPVCVLVIRGDSDASAVFDSKRADDETVMVATWV